MENLRVLVVDDERAIGSLLKAIFCSLGIKSVILAKSGPEALSFLDSLVFDLVLTDQNMPGMTGLELIKKIQSRPGVEPKVALMSTDIEGDLEEKALAIGADAFIDKPITKEKVSHLLERFAKNNVLVIDEDRNVSEQMKKIFPDHHVFHFEKVPVHHPVGIGLMVIDVALLPEAKHVTDKLLGIPLIVTANHHYGKIPLQQNSVLLKPTHTATIRKILPDAAPSFWEKHNPLN